MNISGSGSIPSGEYNDDINVSGSGRLNGTVRCCSLSSSGSVSGSGDVSCSEKVKVSGAAHFDKSLTANHVSVSGSMHVGENCTVKDTIKISGGCKIGGDLKTTNLKSSGGISVGGGIEAEDVSISGSIKCNGLLNAEHIDIDSDSSHSHIGSIGGSDIKIYRKNGKPIKRLSLFTKLAGKNGCFTVDESIEGDTIAIECVHTPLVVGRIVAIGAGCVVDLVQYSEEIEIHPDAKVSKYEKK